MPEYLLIFISLLFIGGVIAGILLIIIRRKR